MRADLQAQPEGRAVKLVLAISLLAALALLWWLSSRHERPTVPRYPGRDDEGDALEPDPYLHLLASWPWPTLPGPWIECHSPETSTAP